MKVLILNGPNLNKLGEREPSIYGTTTLDELEQMCRQRATSFGAEVDFRQSNSESELIGWIQKEGVNASAIIINPAAFTHYSYALREALSECACPIYEVHISNIYSREEWRRTSVVSPVAKGVIAGLGVQGYLFAVDAACQERDEDHGS
ncbi:MAG: type II 3-dehydroquinate dehydratase [Actinomycetota bacterium]